MNNLLWFAQLNAPPSDERRSRKISCCPYISRLLWLPDVLCPFISSTDLPGRPEAYQTIQSPGTSSVSTPVKVRIMANWLNPSRSIIRRSTIPWNLVTSCASWRPDVFNLEKEQKIPGITTLDMDLRSLSTGHSTPSPRASLYVRLTSLHPQENVTQCSQPSHHWNVMNGTLNIFMDLSRIPQIVTFRQISDSFFLRTCKTTDLNGKKRSCFFLCDTLFC